MRRGAVLIALLVAALPAQEGSTRISREIVNEPVYVSSPRYALFVFGARDQTRCWAVLDKSTPKARHYDVLYFDVDGDLDLTDEGERFVARHDPRRAAAGTSMRIRVPEFHEKGSFVGHRDLLVHTVPKPGRKGIYWTLMWQGRVRLSGGYGSVGTEVCQWGVNRDAAPVFRPTAEGVHGFGLYTWGKDRCRLKIGGASKLYVMIGSRGEGPGTLSVFDEDYVDLKNNELVATLVARTVKGARLEMPVRIRHHC
jgi:hypothetical protein